MKQLIFILFCIYSFQSVAQKKADYEKTVASFMKFYNSDQSDSISNLFSDSWGKQRSSLWSLKEIKEVKAEYGDMKSFKFMAVEPGGAILFKTNFAKSTHAMGLVLDKKKKLSTFRFKTTSDYIDSLLLKN